MAKTDAVVFTGLQVRKGSVFFPAGNTSFSCDIAADPAVGPTPGYVLALQAGVHIDLSKLTTGGLSPGLGVIRNLLDPNESSNFVEYGVFDKNSHKFYPWNEALPGEQYPFRISQFFGYEMGSGVIGTGTDGSNVCFHVKGVGGDVPIYLGVFAR